MIVINSISNDGTTTEVIKWIKATTNKKIVRINADFSSLEFLYYDSNKEKFLVRNNGEIYNLFEVESFWYRKGGLLYRNELSKTLSGFNGLEDALKRKIKNELNVLSDFTTTFLREKSKITLGDASNATLNKLFVLDLARKYDLKTPNTYVIKSSDNLNEVAKNSDDLITKALSDGFYLFQKDFSYYSYTELINEQEMKKLNEEFFPSLFQNRVKKKYEVRTFFLVDEFYSMAIFSQSNSKTEVDFRKYDEKKPNRSIPYRLPKEIREKLLNIFNELRLNTGSIDIMVDEDDNYVFLEINPVGQFSMVSYPCSYNLEIKVAQYLTNCKIINE